MTTQIFVNLPVKDLNKTIEFFTALGFTFNPQFTNEAGTCMIIGENIFAMLLTEKFFQTFTKKDIADASKTSEVILAISIATREDVDKMVSDAVLAGGSAPNDIQDHGWMYAHGFQDIDGHLWEVMYLDPAGIPQD